ncbi:hypothetical protein QAD02_007866 [Eretmocerus hayati]|uniref:Uncharacterized protein n=1 Tax=Eretmocerus hayati TaxID=131215 RepID=A0ACC2N4V3_9HYME|nr:hypothetical protein QAD02_007866 [Eretmocerus hayati]
MGKAINKGKIALRSIWRVLNTGNHSNWSATQKLFNATVESTVLYEMGMRGLFHKEQIGEIQTTFLKRLLYLPNCTPGYLLRVETESTSLDVEVIKCALNYWIKLLDMKPNRYPRKMYEKLRDTPHDSSKLTSKSNWYAQLQTILVKADQALKGIIILE